MGKPVTGQWYSSKGYPAVVVNDAVCVEGEEGFFLVLARVDGEPFPLELDADEWKNYVAERGLSPLRRVV
jgi:hypothetical protein